MNTYEPSILGYPHVYGNLLIWRNDISGRKNPPELPKKPRPIYRASEPRVAAWEAADEVHGAGRPEPSDGKKN